MVVNIVKFIDLVMITFLMCRIITNKRNGLALLGTLLICFSTAVLEYIEMGLLEALLFGQGFIILINGFLNNKGKGKILALPGMVIAIIGFLLFSNITWQLSIGMIIIGLLTWSIIKNKKDIKVKDLICIGITVVISTIISLFFYKYSVIDNKENGQIIYYLTSYFYSYILPFNEEIKFVTHEALTCMISVFPMPLVISLIYMYKNDKHSEFVLPMVVVSIIQIISATWLLKIIPSYIMAISVAVAQIYLIIYFLANVKEKLFDMKTAAYVTLGYLVLVAIITVPKAVSSRIMLSCMALGTTLECFLLCKYDDVRIQKIAPAIYGIITLIGFIAYLVV